MPGAIPHAALCDACRAVTLALMALVRLVMIFNPLGIRFEVFHNTRELRRHRLRGGRASRRLPPRLCHGGQIRLLYGRRAYCQPNIRYRTHQWQFRDDDARFTGREVLIECRRRPRPIRRAASGPCGWPTAAASRGSWIPRSTPCAASRSGCGQLTGCPGGLPGGRYAAPGAARGQNSCISTNYRTSSFITKDVAKSILAPDFRWALGNKASKMRLSRTIAPDLAHNALNCCTLHRNRFFLSAFC